MGNFRTRCPHEVFLVSWSVTAWTGARTTCPPVTLLTLEQLMAVMENCSWSIIDYGTFGLWGAVLVVADVVVSSQTFRGVRMDCRHIFDKYIIT